jgi:hypothetical protein
MAHYRIDTPRRIPVMRLCVKASNALHSIIETYANQTFDPTNEALEVGHGTNVRILETAKSVTYCGGGPHGC